MPDAGRVKGFASRDLYGQQTCAPGQACKTLGINGRQALSGCVRPKSLEKKYWRTATTGNHE